MKPFYRQGKYWRRFNPKEQLKYTVKEVAIIQLGFWTYATFILLFFLNFWIALTLVVFVVLHELGHYIVLKIDDDFKGFFLWPTPGCHTNSKGLNQSSSLVYLSGILFSLLAYPLFLAQNYSFTSVYMMAIACGSVDLIQFVLWYLVRR